jgi:hypothetical protein
MMNRDTTSFKYLVKYLRLAGATDKTKTAIQRTLLIALSNPEIFNFQAVSELKSASQLSKESADILDVFNKGDMIAFDAFTKKYPNYIKSNGTFNNLFSS